MRQKTLILVGLILTNLIYGQIDKHGNPVFNSVMISLDTIDNFELTSNYYTIDNNISNKESSVYVSDNLDLADYLKFARDLPAYYFIVHKGQNVSFMIMLLQKNNGSKTTLNYMILNPSNNKSVDMPCNVFGEISEKRVQELQKLNIDSTAKILTMPNGELFLFNGIAYRIQSFEKLKAEVIEIAKQLMNPDSDDNLSTEDYIKKETIGGKLDFKKVLDSEGKGNTLLVYEGMAYNSKDYSILLWGQAVKRLGIKSVKEAITLWESIYEKEMTTPEKKALTNGYIAKIK